MEIVNGMNRLHEFINRNNEEIAKSVVDKLSQQSKALPCYHKFTDKDRDEAWLKFLGKQEPLEQDFMKVLIKLFEVQRKEMLRNIREVMGKSIVKQEMDIDSLVNEIMFNIEAANEAFKTDLIPMMNGAVIAGGISAIETLPTSVVFDPTSEIIVNYIKTKEILITGINETSEKVLRKTLVVGIKEGESAVKITKRVNTVFTSFETGRAKTIARTEVSNALNFGTIEGYNQSNVVKEKQWVTARDELVRTTPFDHTAADGETVSMKEDFMNTGEPLEYPTDPSGSPGNVINCRCNMIPIVIEP